MQYYVDVCAHCGKKVVKKSSSDSSDMIRTRDSFLYLCDVGTKESSRPCLQLEEISPTGHSLYCPDCLLEVITNWISNIKKRGASKIDLNSVIFGNKVSSPCPCCGK